MTRSFLRAASPFRPVPPRRTAPFGEEPGFYPPAGLWLYGNVRLIDAAVGYVREACGRSDHSPRELQEVERRAEDLVFDGRILVVGIHAPAHRRAAVVPLKWGSPRIVVLSGGFFRHLGPNLADEPFPEAGLWRAGFDASTDLAVSRRSPDRLPTFSSVNRTVDRIIERLAAGTLQGELFGKPGAFPRDAAKGACAR